LTESLSRTRNDKVIDHVAVDNLRVTGNPYIRPERFNNLHRIQNRHRIPADNHQKPTKLTHSKRRVSRNADNFPAGRGECFARGPTDSLRCAGDDDRSVRKAFFALFM
jgi:hypothetical protein